MGGSAVTLTHGGEERTDWNKGSKDHVEKGEGKTGLEKRQ